MDVDLARLGLVPEAGLGGEAPPPAADRNAYWRAVDVARERYRSTYGPMLELEHYRGVHQLVGGLPPPRLFPWLEESNFAVVLRARGERRFVMEVERLEPARTSLELRFGTGEGAWTAEALLRGPEDRVEVLLPRDRWRRGVHGFFDVEVRCTSDPCPRMRIERIGLEHVGSTEDGVLGSEGMSEPGPEGWPSPWLTTGR